jgi:tetraacyldisaccharide-1-P 4'-kinase
MDLNIVDFVSFPDHYVFKEIEILRLQEEATQHDAVLVTTLKDMKRLPRKVAHLCRTVEISIIWEDESQIQRLLDSTIQK